MNKKILLAAMALPMLFTACSQDEYLDDYRGQSGIATPNVEGFDVTLAPNLGGDARAIWDNTAAKLTWEANKDLISMYWLGTPATAASESATPTSLTGLYNSVFKTADGEAFSSESMVFVGGNVAVYPANTKFVEQGEIKLSVPHVQDENVILEAPYISNYLNVTKDNIGKNVPGYNNGLYSPVKLAANVLYLYLELDNTAKLTKDHDFEIESVDIVASNKEFAKTANLYVSSEEVKDKGEYTPEEEDADPVATITGSVYAKGTADSIAISSTNIKKTAEGKYEVKFVVLPTQDAMSTLDKDAKIVVNTNCGRLEVSTQEITKDNTNKDVYTNVAEIPEVDKDDKDAKEPVLVGTVTNPFDADTLYTIAEVLETIVTSHVADEDAESNFAGERIGMIFDRTIKADMGNATLNNSKVYSSDDIKKYIAIHTAMNSKEKMNLVLSSRTNKQFAGLTSEALALVEGKNVYDNPATDKDEEDIVVTLSSQDLSLDAAPVSVDSVWVSTPGAVYTPKAETWKGEAAKWILASGNWTMDDTYAPAVNAVSKIINHGTLAIAGTTNEDSEQNTLVATLKNEGTINITGNKTLYLNGEFELGGFSTINVAAAQTLHFAENMAENHDFCGKVVVSENAFLTVENGVTVHSKATIDNSGTIASTGNAGGLCNDGTINIKGANARTYVQDNENGVIKMYQRSDIIKVEQGQGQIVYTYTTSDSADFTKTATDKFTSVVFGSDIKKINLTYKDADLDAIEDVDFTFEGTTTLTASTAGDIAKIRNMVVKKGAHVYVDPDNALTVENLENNGTITIGGTINYTGMYTPGTGAKILTVGSGSIVHSTVAQVNLQNAVTNQLIAALVESAAAGTVDNPVEVELDQDLDLTSPLYFDAASLRSRADAETEEEVTYKDKVYVTINLNGKKIVNNIASIDKTYGNKMASVFYVDNAKIYLTIEGEGEIISSSIDADYNIPVWVRNGNVTINGGTYYSGVDKDGNQSHAVYAQNNSVVTINGGKFSLAGEQKQMIANPALLNCFDSHNAKINVNGGQFYEFTADDAAKVGEGEVTIKEGYTLADPDNDKWYTVEKVTK